MEPKSDSNPFSKPITVYWVNDSWQTDRNLDPETQAWMIQFLENFLAQDDVWDFNTLSNREAELRDLEALDAQVQGECPEALEWIMQAHRKHGG
jgi:hypothetical protein